MAVRLEARPILTLGYRGVLGLTAATLGIDPVAAVMADPLANRPSDPLWAAQAKARRLALYLGVTEANLPMTLAGELAGITKQGVSKLLREIEDARDDPTLDHLLDRVAAAVRTTG
jgi:hypothetical protein